VYVSAREGEREGERKKETERETEREREREILNMFVRQWEFLICFNVDLKLSNQIFHHVSSSRGRLYIHNP